MSEKKSSQEYAQSYEFDTAIRFPLAWETFDVAWSYMFDFFSIGKALDCRPGERVLDFAGGSGYVSELLNRLGIKTISLDLREDILKVGRARLVCDKRLAPQNTHFCCGDGQILPFADESIDGLICMNALHHMPNYYLSILEIFRVLKPGCCAVFSEPGSEHSKSPESKRVIKEFGEIEKDVILTEICYISHMVGFKKIYLLPFSSPDLMLLDLNDMFSEKPISKSDHERNEFSLHPELKIAEFFQDSDNQKRWVNKIIEEHLLFVLKKPGQRELTSVRPGKLNALIDLVAAIRPRVCAGEPVRLTVKVKNIGDTLWYAEPRAYGGFVTLGAKLLDNSDRLVSHSLERANLPSDLAPGTSVEIVHTVTLPTISSGSYILIFDMVDEQVCWFQDKGSSVLSIPIEVESKGSR